MRNMIIGTKVRARDTGRNHAPRFLPVELHMLIYAKTNTNTNFIVTTIFFTVPYTLFAFIFVTVTPVFHQEGCLSIRPIN